MSKPWEINSSSVLVLGDAHQDLDWIRSIMEHEKGNFQRMLFNGDIIHHHKSNKNVHGTRETARFYRSLIDNYDVNIGNHELPIMESWQSNSKFSARKHVINGASGYTKSNSLHFNRELDWTDWRKVTMFRVVNGWLISHAGFGWMEWGYGDVDYNLNRLWNDSQRALEEVSLFPHDLFRVGPSRSDNEEALPGGPVWKDWDKEFVGDLPIKQVVGHTAMHMTVRSKGNSFNIDGAQSTYAIVHDDGEIEFKAMQKGQSVPAVVI